MNPSGGWRALFTPSVFGAFFFFLILWLLGFPQPAFDDLFYCGAAFNLAAGGGLSNPLLARQGFPSHYFFVYPPLHSFMLAGWLKCFGVNAWTVTGFTIFCFIVICVATIAILRRNNAPKYLEWLAPLAATFTLLQVGLRPETSGVALVMAGFALAEWSGDSRSRLFLGFLLMFLGGSCAPRVLMFAVMLAACAGYKAWQSAKQRSLVEICAMWTGAVILAALIFLLLIDFRMAEFWRVFHLHASRIADKRLAILKDYVSSYIGIMQWPLVLLPVALLLFVLKRPKDSLAITGLFLVCAFPFVVLMSAEGLGTLWWMAFLMLVMAGAASKQLGRNGCVALGILVAGILLIENRKLAMNIAGIASGNISLDENGDNPAAKALRPAPEHPLLVDSAAARYVYDYHLPEGCLDLEFGSPFPGELPGDQNSSELRGGDIFVTGPVTATYLMGRTYLKLNIPRWNALGLKSFTFEKFPRRVYVFPAENCKGSRPRMNGQGIMIPNSSGR